MTKPLNTSWRKGIRKEKPVIKNAPAEKLFKSIQVRLSEGHQIGTLLHLLNPWIKLQLKYKRSFDSIAAGLNSAGVPTISGVGQWRPDAVQYLVRRLLYGEQIKRSPKPRKDKSGE